jgi:hypothetical protein
MPTDPSRLYRRQWLAFITILALFALFMVAAGANWDVWAFAALVTIALGAAYCVSLTCPRCTRPLMFHGFAWRPRKACPKCGWPEG